MLNMNNMYEKIKKLHAKTEKWLNGTVPTLGANCRKCFLQGFRAVVQFF